MRTSFAALWDATGFGAVDRELLAAHRPWVDACAPDVLEMCCGRLPGVAGDDARRARLHEALRAWLDRIAAGPWDESRTATIARIGRSFVDLGLTRRDVLGAASALRLVLARVLEGDDAVTALHKAIDADLAALLDDDAMLADLADGLAHGIRNPLNAMRLELAVAAHGLGHREPDLEAVSGALVNADLQIDAVARVLRELLAFARPERLRVVHADLCASVETVIRHETANARDRGVRLSLDADGPRPLLYDVEQMKQVVRRLIQNAVDAAGPGGHVRVRISGERGCVAVQVQDDGAGLPAAAAQLFAPFFTTRADRVGLGLAIVERVVLAHGGTITAASEPGRTTFSIQLPHGALVT